MKKLITIILVLGSLSVFGQRAEYTLKNRHSEETKTIKLNKRLVRDLELYGTVYHVRAVFHMKEGKITMVKRRGNTTKRGNHYVYYRENVYFEQL